MSIAINDENKAYARLIKRFPLRPIRDDEQNEQAAEICDMLIDRGDSLSRAERDYLEVLTDLIAKYESKWDDECADMSPRELILYLMEQNNLAQKDLVPEFGSPSRVSEFLKGERRLSLDQAKRLAERFRLNIASLIDKDDSPKSTGDSATDTESPTAL
jgi:HTH-type transcriptional regulator/antitoxin HigA